jgi:membrane-bound serine protease (ClpP class)
MPPVDLLQGFLKVFKFSNCQVVFFFYIHYNKFIMKRIFKIIVILLIIFTPLLLGADIYKFSIKGPIDSITEEYIGDSFNKVKEDSSVKLVIIELDTPGGFDTSMRTIIKGILNSPVPVVVYVSPQGARAASAGFFITICADIAVMAPGTNMGAAHPVSVTGTKMEDTMKDKVTNDAVSYVKSLAKSRNRNIEWSEKAVRESKSYTAQESLDNNLIDYVADDIDDLIAKIEGKEVVTVNGATFVLKLKGEKMIDIHMSTRQEFLKTITNPSLAYFLLIFGLIGLYLEFSHPGIIIPGVLGGISLLLAFMAFQILPVNYIGLLLILLSIGFFIAEIKVQGFGVLGIGGVISFLLGSIVLINSPIPEMRPTMSLIIMFTVCFGTTFLFLTYKVITSSKRKSETGQEGLAGEMGVARTHINPDSGKVFVHGEWWNAISDEDIPVNSKIIVESLNNFILKVKKLGG